MTNNSPPGIAVIFIGAVIFALFTGMVEVTAAVFDTWTQLLFGASGIVQTGARRSVEAVDVASPWSFVVWGGVLFGVIRFIDSKVLAPGTSNRRRSTTRTNSTSDEEGEDESEEAVGTPRDSLPGFLGSAVHDATFGRARGATTRTLLESDKSCASCDLDGALVERRYGDELVLFGRVLKRYDGGFNYYCVPCHADPIDATLRRQRAEAGEPRDLTVDTGTDQDGDTATDGASRSNDDLRVLVRFDDRDVWYTDDEWGFVADDGSLRPPEDKSAPEVLQDND